MEWNRIVYNYGTVKPKTEIVAKFEYYGDKEIKSVEVQCGCTVSDWKKGSNSVTLKYTAPDVPKHLVSSGVKTFSSTKTATVKFEDNSTQVLTLIGISKSK